MIKPLLLLTAGWVLLASLPACKKLSDPNDESEHEAINKIELRFSRPSFPTLVFVAEDPDGDGGNPPTRIDTIKVQNGQTYSVDFKVINIANGIETDITPSIVAEGRAHELFFIPSGAMVTVTKTDRDLSGLPIGVASSWQIGPPALGSILVKLMHKPGIKGPTDSPDLGHSDLQLPMPLRIQ